MDEGEQLQIAWQTTVVDVQPTSRYGEPGRAPDTAHSSTTIGLKQEGRILRFPSTDPIPRVAETETSETYRWRFAVPPPFTVLTKDQGHEAELSVIVLLPVLPPNDPVLGRWTVSGSLTLDDDGTDVQEFGAGKGDPPLAGRTGFAFRHTVDPEGILDIIYGLAD